MIASYDVHHARAMAMHYFDGEDARHPDISEEANQAIYKMSGDLNQLNFSENEGNDVHQANPSIPSDDEFVIIHEDTSPGESSRTLLSAVSDSNDFPKFRRPDFHRSSTAPQLHASTSHFSGMSPEQSPLRDGISNVNPTGYSGVTLSIPMDSVVSIDAQTRHQQITPKHGFKRYSDFQAQSASTDSEIELEPLQSVGVDSKRPIAMRHRSTSPILQDDKLKTGTVLQNESVAMMTCDCEHYLRLLSLCWGLSYIHSIQESNTIK